MHVKRIHEMLEKLTLNDLYQYLVYCKNVRDNNATTRARKTSTLRIYFKYLHIIYITVCVVKSFE